jgi:4-hydroxy-tetrahydrodipicolinate reductase
MRIAIVGYGKMGRLVEAAALARGHEIVARFDAKNNEGGAGLTPHSLAGADVAIEFSTPGAVLANLERLINLDLPTVVGTTGWDETRGEIRQLVAARDGALVYGANFSLGVNLFFRIVREAAALIARHEEYDPFLIEMHHRFKRDAPSGTALVLRRLLAEGYGARAPEAISLRAGHLPGTHEVGFDAEADTITLTHTARSRAGFASGAVRAAELIAGRRGFIEFSELLLMGEES